MEVIQSHKIEFGSFHGFVFQVWLKMHFLMGQISVETCRNLIRVRNLLVYLKKRDEVFFEMLLTNFKKCGTMNANKRRDVAFVG